MSKLIPDEIIDEIRTKNDIVDVIQSYIPLKRAGNSFKALCPFHNEKTASFNVNPTRQMFYCFGCGKGGDVVKFIMDKENTDYPTALRMLADRAGIIIPEKSGTTTQSAINKNRKDRLYKMHEELAEFFHKNLLEKKVTTVSNYVLKRAVDINAINAFKLGAAADSWDDALKLLSKKEYSEEEIIEAGIILRNPDSGNIYDRFRNRLMFPIRDELGRTVGFSARTIDDSEKEAKYVNSPETPIFKKSRILYALDKARENIRKKDFCVLCEGQLDVIAMHNSGIDNAVAPQGTAFTSEQATILKRYTRKIRICFDGDEAGQKATLRAIEILLSLDMEPSVVVLPQGEDPDSLLRNGEINTLDSTIATAIPFFDFLLKNKFPNSRILSPWEKSSAATDIAEYIAKIASPVLRASFSAILAEKIGISEKTIISEMKKKRETGKENQDKTSQDLSPDSGLANSPEAQIRKAEEIILELCIAHGVYCKKLAEDLPNEMISSTPVGKAIELAVSMTLNGEWENIVENIRKKLSEENDTILCRILALGNEYDGDLAAKAYNDCVKIIKNYHLGKKISQLNELFMNEKNNDVKNKIALEISALRKEIINLNSKKNGPPKIS